MTHENKKLLLKDLCARLPYGVKICYIYNGEECVSTIEKIDAFGYIWDNYNGCYHVKEIKPYLFPLSSMTEEQKKEYGKVCELDTEILSKHPMDGTPFPALYNSHDWLHKNHFDIYGLIEKGLAIDATRLNIY